MNHFEKFDIDRAMGNSKMLIEASAGTGKTYSLEHLYLRYLLEKKYSVREILAVTFTEKATNELKIRIRNAVKEKIKDSVLSGNSRETEILKSAYMEFSDVSIFTLHGFCKFCLGNYPFESSVSFSNKIIESDELYHEAVMDYLRSIDQSGLEEEYYCFRNSLKDIEEAPVFFTSLLKKIKNLENCIIIPDEKTALRFKEFNKDFRSRKGIFYKAVKQLCSCDCSFEDFENISKALKLGLRASSFSALADFTGNLKKAETAFDIFSDHLSGNADRLGKYTLNYILSKDKDPELLDSRGAAVVNAVTKFLEAADEYADPGNSGKYLYHNIGNWCFINNSLKIIRRNIRIAKESRSLLDFDDLISLTGKALQSGSASGFAGLDKGEPSALAAELKRRFRVVLVDEFQDTDIYQWDILSSIFSDAAHEAVLIGDPKQSIYRFRGADIEVYFNAAKSLEKLKYYRLETNYRSLDPVVKGINRIFSSVFRFKTGGGHKIEYHDVESCDKQLDSIVSPGIELLGVSAENGSFTSKEKIFSAIETIFCAEISELIHSGVTPGEICILMEANNECISVYNALKEAGIPAVFEGDIDLFSTSEIYQFVDLFYALSLPGDISRLKKALFSDFFNYSADEISMLDESGEIDNAASLFALWNEKINRGKLFEVMNMILKEKNPVRVFLGNKHPEKAEPFLVRKLREAGGERSITNFMHIAEILTAKNSAGKDNAYSLLRYIISVIEGAEKEDEKLIRLDRDFECVRVMTIHKSKGLEFPIVFFGGGYNDPGSSRTDYYEFIENNTRYADFTKNSLNLEKHKNETWEEKKRLYYVAFTRTVKKLYLPVFEDSGIYNITNIYASMVYDSLEKNLSAEEIPFTVPLYQADDDIKKKGIRKKELKSIICSNIYSLLKSEYSDGRVFIFKEVSVLPGAPPIKRKPVLTAEPDAAGTEASEPALKSVLIDFSLKKKIPVICSYTSITKSGHSSNLIKQIEVKEPEMEEDETSFDDSEIRHIKGADFGNIMHAMLEAADYKTVMTPGSDLKDLAIASARRYVSSESAEKCVQPAVDLLCRTLASSLIIDGKEIRIGEIPAENRRHEVEFILKIKEGKSSKLMGLEKLELDKGYLKGYIDLIFRLDNRIYIADWKTNYLGSRFSDYSYNNLQKAMSDAGYVLQMNLYMAALNLMLERERGLSAGGCFYLFIRGLNPDQPAAGTGAESGSGVYFAEPDISEIGRFKNTFIDMEISFES